MACAWGCLLAWVVQEGGRGHNLEDVQEIKLFRSSASYSIIAFGALFCFVMIIIVMIMIIIMIFIIIIVIITQPLVGSLFPVAIWLADFLSPSCPACAPLPRSLWRV